MAHIIQELKNKAFQIRSETLEMFIKAGTVHVTSFLSSIDILVTLYYGDILRFHTKNSEWKDRDRFLISHAQVSPALYAILRDLGFFDKKEDDSGPTHHMIEDIAIMRSMPHIRIDRISDGVMAAYFAEQSCSKDKTITNYVRLDKAIIYLDGTKFSSGVEILRDKGDTCLVATGSMTHTALSIADSLTKKGIHVGVMDLYNFPVNESGFLKEIQPFSQIITIEEHFLAGGLGSTVLEVLNDHRINIPVHRMGLAMDKGYCYKYGGREVIRRHYGIDKGSLLKKITSIVR